MNLPLVTTIISNYNHEDKVLEAIQSVIDQDYPNLAISIVDDGSTDDSVAKLSAFFGRELIKDEPVGFTFKDRTFIVSCLSKNVGRSKARNLAIQAAWEPTHIFANLDSDDLYLPGKISKSVMKMMEDPQVIGGIYSDFINENGSVILTEYKQPFDADELRNNCIVNNDSIVSKLALETCGLYDESMEVAEDWDLWLRISKRFLLLHIPEPLLKVRITPKGATSTVNMGIWQKNWQLIGQRLMSGYYA